MTNVSVPDVEKQLPKLIELLGEGGFMLSLLEHLHNVCGADHLALFVFDESLSLQQLSAVSVNGDSLAKRAGEIYTKTQFYQFDPNVMQLQQTQNNETRKEISYQRLRATDIPDQQYKTQIYDRFKLIDRASILFLLNGRWAVINFYRNMDSGEFTDTDLTRLQENAHLVSALCSKHYQFLPHGAWPTPSLPNAELLEQLIKRVNTNLSKREVEVCGLALLGVTSEGIGLRLGVLPSTIATLRKRAFAKLGVSSLNELFGLCLGKLIE